MAWEDANLDRTDFPGGPGARTLHFYRRGQFPFLVRELRCFMPRRDAKK